MSSTGARKRPQKDAETQVEPKRFVDSVDDAAAGYSPGKDELHFWKMLVARYALIFHMCRKCKDRCFKDKERVTRMTDRVRLRLDFCEDCCNGNIFLSNVYYKHFQKPLADE